MTGVTRPSPPRLGSAPPAADLDPAERLTTEQLRALQWERLQWTLRYAYDNVPHYAAKFTAAGVRPEDCRTPDDFRKFPYTTKEDLRQTYPFGMFAVPGDRVRRVHASSGTTGAPTVAAYTETDLDNWATLVARSIRAAGGR